MKKALQQPLVNPNGTDQSGEGGHIDFSLFYIYVYFSYSFQFHSPSIDEHTNEVTGLTFDGKHLYSIDKKGVGGGVDKGT